MIVSWNWLKDYVTLDMEPAEVEHRLAMAGLNHEGTERVGDDLAIDLEVTSNRPDCLGHIGVAREVGVLWDRPIAIPTPDLPAQSTRVADLCKVRIDCPELCYRYTARVIQGAAVGPSPDWLVQRLRSIGVASINSVVDVTNYVMMECGQPLHAFDFSKIDGREIIVRPGHPGEQFRAIDHRTYDLTPDTCVIADRSRAVALGGVMGGADSEVSDSTTDLLIEAAEFAPLSIRTTARNLNLHSPSSYRFERGVDPDGIDWASRRCCQLILELAGGKLADGVIDAAGRPSPPRPPIVLRFSQLKRILGIDVEPREVRRILTDLGNQEVRFGDTSVEVIPPSWRRDLTREIDLVEEVARIHGYDEIPEDVSVPMIPSHRSDDDRVLEMIRGLMTAAGFSEALTASVVSRAWCDSFSPWTEAEPIECDTPMLRGANMLRRSLVPSLLGARQINQSLSNPVVELFEIAKAYLPRDGGLPEEKQLLTITSGKDYIGLKGVLEGLLEHIKSPISLEVADTQIDLLDPLRSSQLRLNGKRCGYLGQVSESGLKQFGLRSPSSVAEIDVRMLIDVACLVPQYQPQSPYPLIAQDVNLIMDESVRWSDLAATVREAAGSYLEELQYRETYRDPERDGAGKKRLLFTFTLRAADRTLTNEEADQIRDRIVDACRRGHHTQHLS